MQRVSAAAARGESGGGAASASPGDALQAFREAIAGIAAQLEVLRRQEALAEVVVHATGASEASGLAQASLCLDKLQKAQGDLPL